jgi:dTDP-4-dehydrorhamnose 3,5-epimerase
MKVVETRLAGVLILEPRVFRDERGHFAETWHQQRYREAGIRVDFAQDNISFSRHGVLRGLHYQNPTAQGKLVSVLHGAVFDVAVDLRRGSPTFGQWAGTELSGENLRQLWIPEGFAHGFVVTGESAVFSYKCTNPYSPAHERSLRWDDPEIGIEWPIANPILSPKDAQAPLLGSVSGEWLFGNTTAAISQR